MTQLSLADLNDHSIYQPPPAASCDVVMKGGITSGVIYPRAICELARKYRLRQVGGSSAGAIAAAAAAAAEHGRASSSGGFSRLAQLPQWLAETPAQDKDSNLFHLFQPQPSTTPYYKLLVGQMKVKGTGAKLGVVARAAINGFPIRLLLPLLVGLAVGLLSLLDGFDVWDVLNVVAWAVLGLLVGVVLVAIGAVKGFKREVTDNGYGLCKGSQDPAGPGPPPLSDWLTDELDRMAGIPAGQGPLTFGDLEKSDIHLSMMTTGLNTGLPYRLPFDQQIWFFKPEELKGYFPDRVLNALKANARSAEPDDPTGYVRMPATADLPVVVAVRMSLSFPVLLSAVPLWAIDYRQKNAFGKHEIKKHWFSDGGIVSNFPLHFFDTPLPAAPTFGINLAKKTTLAPNPADNTYLPTKNVAGILPRRASFVSLVGFGMQILDTMQNWSDNALTHVPGYRDRVVTVYHDDNEGGMNLNMPSDLIDGLATRGQAAGVRLSEEFDFVNHRWVRYRSTMELLEKLLEDYRRGFEASQPGVPSYEAMIEGAPPRSYRKGWTNTMVESARQRTWQNSDSLVRIAEGWAASGLKFSDEAPSPTPTLRIGPQV